MKIELVDRMGNDSSVSNAARVSFHKHKDKFDDGDVKLLHYLAKHGHTSPFGHTSISLRCSAPIFLARQLGKHQVGLTWNEVSRRYVDEKPEFFQPLKWRKRPDKGIKQGSGDDIEEDKLVFHDYFRALDTCVSCYENMLADGVAPEMARMILPQSMMTEWIWTGSLLAFHRVYRLRSEEHAQLEAQQFAEMLEKAVQPLFPNAWGALNNV